MTLRDCFADAVMVIRLSPESEPTAGDYEDADYLLMMMLRNNDELKVWLSENGFIPTSEITDLLRVDI
jgi:hypothetical protein